MNRSPRENPLEVQILTQAGAKRRGQTLIDQAIDDAAPPRVGCAVTVLQVGCDPETRGGAAGTHRDERVPVRAALPRLVREFGWVVFLGLWVMFCGAGCKQPPRPEKPTSTAKSPTIASLVPAATDLLIGMNAAGHLVAVSNYDFDPQTSRLPRVGDYETIDWEKVASLHPDILITEYGPDRTPAGMIERMQQLKIRQLNLKFHRLDDIYDSAGILGEACGEPAKAAAVLAITKARIEAVHQRIAGDQRVPALIVTGASGLDFAGRGNFLNDLLNEAGGQNVITSDGYPTLDREAVAALRPQVILHLLPDADAAAKEKAAKFWGAFQEMPAVKEHRVFLFTEPYVMIPGSHVGEMATRFAGVLHPDKVNPSESSILRATP